jgi:hypothetical protein
LAEIARESEQMPPLLDWSPKSTGYAVQSRFVPSMWRMHQRTRFWFIGAMPKSRAQA